ncbi:unnamed protein product [Phytophthora lilii]|uniref:Unnamed protein product n=1 Tax=Phytophthora lilii TaxID=2077276 RepID=A0A9W6WNL3_9STRA|nr:unnamed protein product [Phytophthora lilii]
MPNTLRVVFAAAIAAAAVGNAVSLQNGANQQVDQVSQLQVGEYYKPSAEEGSGVPNTTAAFRRSPCPALNALANHGYLPRNGQNIPKGVLKAAMMNVFHIANDTATSQVSQVPDVFSLDFLSRHGFIEHDASLVRTDVYFGFDPMELNVSLADDLLARADADGKISTTAIAQTRRDRTALCRSNNPECTFGQSESTTSFLQAALLLLGLGEGDYISVDHARSFLVEERIPADYPKYVEPVTVAAMTAKFGELVAQVS